MTPKKMNITLKVILTVIIFVLVGGLYISNQKLTDIANKTSEFKAQAEFAQKQLDTFKLTKIKVESLGYVDELAAKVLPEDKEQSAIIAEISLFAKRARLSLSQIEFPEKEVSRSSRSGSKAGAAPKGVAVIPVTVKFKEGARYENILEFLRYTEENQRKIQVASIDLKPDAKNRSLLNEVTVVLSLYSKQSTATSAEKK